MRILLISGFVFALALSSSNAATWPPTIAGIGDSQTSTQSASFLKHLPEGWNYIDLAIVGAGVPQTLANSFTPALNDGTLANANALVIMHGTNDVVFGYEHGFPNNTGSSANFNSRFYPPLTEMIVGAQTIGLPVVIVAPPSVHPDWMPRTTWLPWVASAEVYQARITLLAAGLKELAEQYGAGFVDGDAIFGAAGYPASYFHTDFLHFSTAGHSALAEAINPTLEVLLAPVPLPAALPLFLTAIGLFAFMSRRRQTNE